MKFKETNMKYSQWLKKLAAAGSFALVLATPAFAQSRGNSKRGNNNTRWDTQSSSRSDRVTMQGRISSFSRANGGYRVRFERDNRSFFVPESYIRNRVNNLRVGIDISLGGIFRGSEVYVDAVSWPGDRGYGYNNDGYGYESGYVRGVVDRVDERAGVVWIRDEASGRLVEADMRGTNRYSRIDARDLRRGDRVELSGQWIRGNIFAVDQVDSVRSGRRY
jgi:hypothetical protein